MPRVHFKYVYCTICKHVNKTIVLKNNNKPNRWPAHRLVCRPWGKPKGVRRHLWAVGPQLINYRRLEGCERSPTDTCAPASSPRAPRDPEPSPGQVTGHGVRGRNGAHMFLFPALKHFQTFVEKKWSTPRPTYRTWFKGWLFTGRIVAEAEAPILWLADVKSRLTRKDPDVGKDWGEVGKGATEDEMAG